MKSKTSVLFNAFEIWHGPFDDASVFGGTLIELACFAKVTPKTDKLKLNLRSEEHCKKWK